MFVSRFVYRAEHRHRRAACVGRVAFTMLELVVVISIIGVLVSLTLISVQAAREQTRRSQCTNNLRQQAVALHAFHSISQRLPFGNDRDGDRNQAWCSAVLGHLEQTELVTRWDRKRKWDDPAANFIHSQVVLPVFRCPSSVLDFQGDTDYAGIMGSALADEHSIIGFDINNGVLISSSPRRRLPVSLAEIFDGTSQTVFIAEVVDRLPEEHGKWADGNNVISHDNGGINVYGSGEIFSRHPGGANVAFADGSVHFLIESIDHRIVGALCSRNGREAIASLD